MIDNIPAYRSDSINIRPYDTVSFGFVRHVGTRTRVTSSTPWAAMSIYEIILMPRISRTTRVIFKMIEMIDSTGAILGQ